MFISRIIRRYSTNKILWPQHPTKPLAFDPNAVYARLQELHKDDPPSMQPVQTRPRTAVMDKLLMRLYPTPDQNFINQSNVLIGPRGTGKSTALRQIQSVSRDLDSHLHVAYVDLSRTNKLEPVLPSTILGRIANMENISYIPDDYNRVEPILEALAKNNIRAALLYDETERLYIRDSQAGQDFLDDLQVLGNTNLRNVYTMLCGSSGALPMLISNAAKQDAVISAEYQLQAFDLNDTKFNTIRVPAAPYVQDMENIVQIYMPKLGPEHRMRLAAMLTFWTGVSLRRACETLEALITRPDNVVQVLKDCLLDNNSVILHNTREDNTYREFKGIIDGILKNLIKQNKRLISGLPKPDYPDQLLDAITKHDWDKELIPVSPWDIKDDLGKDVVMGSVIKLVDKGWFLQDHYGIYPISIAQLYYYNLWLHKGKGENIRNYMTKMLDKLQDGLVEAIKIAIQIQLYGGE